MKFDYRTLAWSIGGGFLLVVIASNFVSSAVPLWTSIPVTIGGMLFGFILDQYYKKEEQWQLQGM